jgi:DNA-binding MarR family transcriptional regulator
MTHQTLQVEDDDDIPTAIREMLVAQRAVFRRLLHPRGDEWIRLDLSMGQLKTLMVLASQAPMTVSQLAETLDVGKPTASVLVDRLVNLRLVMRTEDAEDRRRTLVALTTEGSELVTHLRQGSKDTLIRWLSALAPADLAALTRGMQALAAIAEQDDPSPEASKAAKASETAPTLIPSN